MHVDDFIQTFAGERTLSLLRCMAVANGNLSLDSTSVTLQEAKRYIVTYETDADISDYHDWDALREEIYTALYRCDSNPHRIRRYICRMLMDLRTTASYFHNAHPDANARLVNEFFSCIVRSMRQAVKLLETVGYASDLGTYNHKWNKPCFHDITRIGTAIDRLGNMIQGGLYENGYATTIFEYQNQCGVTLLSDITPESLSVSMNWTTDLARFHLGATASTQRIAPLTTIGELRQAIKDGKINDKGRLLCSNRAFVLYCYDNLMFLPMNKTDWKRIDSLLTSDKGKPLTAEVLSKVSQQLRKEEYIEDRIRFGNNHFAE